MIFLPLLSLKPLSDCHPLSVPAHGSISTSVLSKGTVVVVTSDTGYTLCLELVCYIYILPVSDCQPLTVPAHGSISTNGLSQGTVVVVTCDTGYTLFGATIIECLTTADWNNVEPTCELGNKLTSIKTPHQQCCII